jgi:hypothetical protein
MWHPPPAIPWAKRFLLLWKHPDPDLAEDLYRRLKGASVSLQEFSLRLNEIVLARFRERAGDDVTTDLGNLYSDLATRRSMTGKYELALEAANDAVGVFRRLFVAKPDENARGIIVSLTNLSARYGDLGRYDGSLEASREFVEIARGYRESSSIELQRSTAMAIFNYGSRLTQNGRLDEALDACTEAEELFADLARSEVSEDRFHLAKTRVQKANVLGDLHRSPEALASAELAYQELKKLVDERPDSYASDYFLAGNTLSIYESANGRLPEATHTAEEALRLAESLFEQLPDAFRSDYSVCLNNLAARYREAGELYRSVEYFARSAEQYRVLAGRSSVFGGFLASALTNLAATRSEIGDFSQAVESGIEAAELFRSMAEADPGPFLAHYGSSLINLAITLTRAHRLAEAVAEAERARDVYRRLVAINPHYYSPTLASILVNLATIYGMNNQKEEARASIEEAIPVLRRLDSEEPGAHAHTLALALNNWSSRLLDTGDIRDPVEFLADQKIAWPSQVHANPELSFADRLRDEAQRDIAARFFGHRFSRRLKRQLQFENDIDRFLPLS